MLLCLVSNHGQDKLAGRQAGEITSLGDFLYLACCKYFLALMLYLLLVGLILFHT